jgi:DNA-binding transcriptional LysR family regulator
MDLSLRQVRAFVTVARVKSFTRAAVLLHVAQPTLTVQIRRLEEDLAVKLFDRNPRSVELTRMGRDLLPVFERLVNDLDGVLVDVREQAAGRRGLVRIAALPSAAASILPDAIRTFRERHPGADFRLKDVIASRVMAMVRAEEVELGIMGGDAGSSDVETLFVFEDHMQVVFPDGHPIGAAERVTPEVLARYPLVMMDPETSVRAIVDSGFRAAGLVPNTACEATYMMTAIGMVQAGLGLTILPASAREIRTDPKLSCRPIAGAQFARRVSLIGKAGRTLSPLGAAFAAHLAEELGRIARARAFSSEVGTGSRE